MASDFEMALQQLGNEDIPLRRELLAACSGPSRSDAKAFMTCFRGLSPPRRRETLARMVEHAEGSFDLDYADLFRLCLDDADPVVRQRAIEGLWEDERADLAMRLLSLMLEDPDSKVRAAAAMSLGRFVYLSECDELGERQGQLIRDGLERVIHDSSDDIEVARRAIEAIAFINDSQVRRIIDQAYAHSDDLMRQSAVFAMGRSADHFWAETVLAELYAHSPAMRFEAARACGEMQLKRALDALIGLVDDSDSEARQMAIWAVGQIGGSRAREVLVRCLERDDEDVRAAAEDALSELEFANVSLDLMIHDPSLSDLDGGLDEEDRLESMDEPDADSDEGDDAWPDEFLELS